MSNFQGKEERANFIFRIDKREQKQFKVNCTRNNVIMSDVINEFIERYNKHYERR
jgi:hypothetical protein